MTKTYCPEHQKFIIPSLAVAHTERTGHAVRQIQVTREPSMAMMERWSNDGVAKAIDGCRVEPDGYCSHDLPSWIMKLGFI